MDDPAGPGEVTRLLEAWKRGEADAESHLIPLIYNDLHALAKREMRRERSDHTLQPTALVNEAYLRLMHGKRADWQGRTHFLAAAARAMRHILVDHARQHAAAKRPDARPRVVFEDALPGLADHSRIELEQMLLLDEALTRLAAWSPRQAQIVEMTYFGGLTEAEVANVLRLSVRTIRRDWQAARAWLQTQIGTHQK